MLSIAFYTVIVAGMILLLRAQAPKPRRIVIWTDDVERRLLHEDRLDQPRW